MNLVVRTNTGDQIGFEAEHGWTLEQLYAAIAKDLSTQIDSITLVLRGSNLCLSEQTSNKKLGELGIADGDTLNLTQNMEGGNSMRLQSFFFNSLEKPNVVEFSRNAPRYRIVCRGLNLQGKCKNKKCLAFEQKVWVMRGYGTFSLNKENRSAQCPVCSQKLGGIDNLGIFKARMKVEGEIVGNDQTIIKNYTSKQEKGIMTFQGEQQTKVQWHYLELTVENL